MPIRLRCLALLMLLAAPTLAAAKPIEVRVVIVTTWNVDLNGKDTFGELHAWRTRWPLQTELPFPLGVHPLLYDPRRHVLAILTGEATARAAASITALGADPRFDLTHAYWIVAGTAGVDPKVASAGSAAWARWVVDGDLAQELDPRDAPPDWPTGVVPYGRTTPYQTPAPPAHGAEANVAYALNPALVDWAYGMTQGVKLPDDALQTKLRAPYSGVDGGLGAAPPFVLEGEALASARNWYGEHLNDWARAWVGYWTGGKGVFAMSDEEDTGVMQGLSFLAHAGRADLARVLILRAGSDYTIAPPGMPAADFLAKETHEGFPATPEALNALYLVASPVVAYLADNWNKTRNEIPGAAAAR